MLRISRTVITLMTYHRHGLPEWTYFDDGHATEDLYDGLGRHMATMRYTMETQVFGEHETQVPVYQSTRSYTGDGVISEDGKWQIVCQNGLSETITGSPYGQKKAACQNS